MQHTRLVDFPFQLSLEYEPWTMSRFTVHAIRVLRYLFWLGVLHVLYHFLYVNAFSHNLDLLVRMDTWPLSGIA